MWNFHLVILYFCTSVEEDIDVDGAETPFFDALSSEFDGLAEFKELHQILLPSALKLIHIGHFI